MSRGRRRLNGPCITLDDYLARYTQLMMARLGAGRPVESAFPRDHWLEQMARDGVAGPEVEQALDALLFEVTGLASRIGLRAKTSTRSARRSPDPVVVHPPSYVYILRGTKQTVLYVGVADDPAKRFVQHARTKDWWPMVANIEIEEHPSRDAAERRERKLIGSAVPLFNIVHNRGRQMSLADVARAVRVSV